MPEEIDRYVAKRSKIDIGQLVKFRFENNLTFEEIGKKFGVSRQAAEQAFSRHFSVIRSRNDAESYEKYKPVTLSAVEAELLVALIDKGKLEKASVNNVAYAFGVVSNNNKLARNQSTENISSVSMVARVQAELDKTESLLKSAQIVGIDVEVIEKPQ